MTKARRHVSGGPFLRFPAKSRAGLLANPRCSITVDRMPLARDLRVARDVRAGSLRLRKRWARLQNTAENDTLIQSVHIWTSVRSLGITLHVAQWFITLHTQPVAKETAVLDDLAGSIGRPSCLLCGSIGHCGSFGRGDRPRRFVIQRYSHPPRGVAAVVAGALQSGDPEGI